MSRFLVPPIDFGGFDYSHVGDLILDVNFHAPGSLKHGTPVRTIVPAQLQHFTAPTHPAANLGTGDFTLTCQCNRNAGGGEVILAAKWKDGDNYWLLGLNASSRPIFTAVVGGVTKITVVTPGGFTITGPGNHTIMVCVDRDEAANTKIYVDGADQTDVGSTTVSDDTVDNTGALFIGSKGGTSYWDGTLSRLHLVKGHVASAAEATWLDNTQAGRFFCEFSQPDGDGSAMAPDLSYDLDEASGQASAAVGPDAQAVNAPAGGGGEPSDSASIVGFVSRDVNRWQFGQDVAGDRGIIRTEANGINSRRCLELTDPAIYAIGQKVLSGTEGMLWVVSTVPAGGVRNWVSMGQTVNTTDYWIARHATGRELNLASQVAAGGEKAVTGDTAMTAGNPYFWLARKLTGGDVDLEVRGRDEVESGTDSDWWDNGALDNTVIGGLIYDDPVQKIQKLNGHRIARILAYARQGTAAEVAAITSKIRTDYGITQVG